MSLGTGGKRSCLSLSGLNPQRLAQCLVLVNAELETMSRRGVGGGIPCSEFVLKVCFLWGFFSYFFSVKAGVGGVGLHPKVQHRGPE